MYNNGFRTITASKAGTCKRCGYPIEVGQRIRWAPRAGAFHLRQDCGGDYTTDADAERSNLAYWERVDNYRELGHDPNAEPDSDA